MYSLKKKKKKAFEAVASYLKFNVGVFDFEHHIIPHTPSLGILDFINE